MVDSKETAGEMLQRLGADGKLWAEEFNKTAVKLGYSEMDEGWLIGWFANAIENTCATRRCWALSEENARLQKVEDSILACEVGYQITDVLANYRTVRRSIQDHREAIAKAEAN